MKSTSAMIRKSNNVCKKAPYFSSTGARSRVGAERVRELGEVDATDRHAEGWHDDIAHQ